MTLGLTTINGLPAHILIVHAVVVFVPLSAIALIAALRPTIAQRLGWVLPALSIFTFVSVLAAMNAGGWLQNHVSDTALVRRHTGMAGQLWPFSAAVTLVSLVVWWRTGRSGTPYRSSGRRLRRSRGALVLSGFVVILALASVVEVARIGDSGARASWNGHFSSSARHH